MRDNVQVVMAQMEVAWLEPEINRRKMVEFVQRAKDESNADLVVFPELANVGYLIGRDRDFGYRYTTLAETVPGPTTKELGQVARANHVYIVAGLSQRDDVVPGTIYNSVVLINPRGEVMAAQAKVHIPGEEKHYFTAGNSFQVHRTELGNIALQICYDAYYPEMARMQALMGAEIICTVFNSPQRGIPSDMIRFVSATRALENKLYVIGCNRVGSQDAIVFFGNSVVANPLGEIVVQGGREEQLLSAELDGKLIISERAWMPVFRDRRPELYKPELGLE